MKKNSPTVILDTIQESFLKQFDQKLDDRLLCYVIDKEIQKKKEAFLQVQLSTFCFNLDSLNELKDYLKKNSKQLIAIKEKNQSTKKKSSKRGFSGYSKKTEEESTHEDLSDNEANRLKRRAYARSYYHRKKAEKDDDESSHAKLFKTTPEQRAYQRAYYKRKKAEGGAVGEQNVLTRALAASVENQIFEENLNRRKNKGRNNPQTPESPTKEKNSFADYDSLSADRIAIENAFRPGSDDGIDLRNEDPFCQNSAGSAIPYSTKTKLRKAKAGLSTSS